VPMISPVAAVRAQIEVALPRPPRELLIEAGFSVLAFCCQPWAGHLRNVRFDTSGTASHSSQITWVSFCRLAR